MVSLLSSLKSGALPPPRKLRLAIVLACVLALCSAGLAGAVITSWKISGDLPDFGMNRAYAISPDGKYVVYEADVRVDQMYELFSVPVLGGEPPAPLNPPLVNGGMIASFTITPDSQFIVYRVDMHINDHFELYAVPITGGEAVRLDEADLSDRDVEDFQITPDSQRVVYRADQETDDQFELYMVPIGGGESLKLNEALVADEDVLSYAISPNSSRVVYLVGEYLPGFNNAGTGLFSVPLTGGIPEQLNPPLPADGIIYEFKIAPGNQWVVYTAVQDETTLQNELYSVPLLGGESNKLNRPLVGNAYGYVHEFKITPNGLGVVYTATEEEFRVFELYSVDMTGSYHYKLNLPIFTWMSQIHFEITPDSSHVVYLGDPGEEFIHYLYSASILGGPPVQLNPPPIDGGDVIRFEITPNSLGVVYMADQETDDVSELYSVYLDGSNLTDLTGDMQADRSVMSFNITPNNLGVVFIADLDVDDFQELYLVSIFGGDPVKLNGPLPGADADVDNFIISPDSERVVYQLNHFYQRDLYVALDGYVRYLPVITR